MRIAIAAEARRASGTYGLRRMRDFPCRKCGVPVPTTGHGPVLCVPHRREAAASRSRRDAALRRGARGTERYTLAQIAERDGWRCHLCKRFVDSAISPMQPRGATIDHLIPLSDGGPDTPLNVALAHRECNVARGRRGAAQLRLIG